MVYITDWDDYQRAVLDLYESAPTRTRFVTKYRHCDGLLVLKVTDDRTCFKYRTDQVVDMKRWDRLTRRLTRVMANRTEQQEQEELARLEAEAKQATTVSTPTKQQTGGRKKKGKRS